MEEPFIKTLSSPTRKYFYDVNTNSIVPASEKLYTLLNKKTSIESLREDSEVRDEVNKLIEGGYLKPSSIKTIKHPMSDDIEYFLDKRINQMTLQLTQNCNLRCSYCPYTQMNSKQRHFGTQSMNADIGKMAIDFLKDHSTGNQDVTIGYYGGEPLLQFKLIKELTTYAKKVLLGKKVNFTITTNGTLLTPSILEFLNSNNCSLLLSIDGPQKIQNKNRYFANGKGSFDKVYQNLSNLREVFGERLPDMLSINMVMDPSNDFDEINNLFTDPLFKNISIQAVLLDDEFNDEKVQIKKEFITKYRYHEALARLKYLGIVKDLEISPIFQSSLVSIDTNYTEMQEKSFPIPESSAPAGPCIPGQRRLFVDYRGNFFPCERVSELSTCMNIGNLRSGFNIDSAKRLLNVSQIVSDKCKNCFAFNKCTLCCKQADDDGILSREKMLKACTISKAIVEDELRDNIMIYESKIPKMSGVRNE